MKHKFFINSSSYECLLVTIEMSQCDQDQNEKMPFPYVGQQKPTYLYLHIDSKLLNYWNMDYLIRKDCVKMLMAMNSNELICFNIK